MHRYSTMYTPCLDSDPRWRFTISDFLEIRKSHFWRNLIAADVKLDWRTCKILCYWIWQYFQRKSNPKNIVNGQELRAVRTSIFHCMTPLAFAFYRREADPEHRYWVITGSQLNFHGCQVRLSRMDATSQSPSLAMAACGRQGGVTIWKSRPKRVITPVATRITLPNNSVPCWMYLLVQNTSWDTEHFCPIIL